MLKYFIGALLIRAVIMREYRGASSNPTVDSILTYYLPSSAEQYRGIIDIAADSNDIPRPVLAALLRTESGFNPGAYNAVSGARGMAQFMPDTAREWGVNTSDAQSSIQGAARYLRFCINYMGGDIVDGVAAYNWGIGNMSQYRAGAIKSMPLETIAYLTKVYYSPMLIGV